MLGGSSRLEAGGTSWGRERPLRVVFPLGSGGTVLGRGKPLYFRSGVFPLPNPLPFPARLRATALRTRFGFCWGVLLTFALGRQKIFVCWSLSCWGSNKFLFVVCFCAGEAKNFCSLFAFALGNEQIFVCCSLLRLGGQQHFVVREKRGGAGAVVRGRCGRCRLLCGG